MIYRGLGGWPNQISRSIAKPSCTCSEMRCVKRTFSRPHVRDRTSARPLGGISGPFGVLRAGSMLRDWWVMCLRSTEACRDGRTDERRHVGQRILHRGKVKCIWRVARECKRIIRRIVMPVISLSDLVFWVWVGPKSSYLPEKDLRSCLLQQ
jgi:hypothetical protein